MSYFMDSLFQSILLGIVQGMSEFLPISSSGHLILAPWFFGFDDPGLSFDVALHVGTLLAVVTYFWRDWLNIFRIKRDMLEYEDQPNLLFMLILATLPGVLAGFLLEKQAETIFRNPILVATMLFAFGALLFLADRISTKSRSFRAIGVIDAFLIGLSQALAIVPGVSRSGITITAALFRNIDRESAARFSFLLSTPIIFGAAALHVKDIVGSISNPIFIAGVAASAVSGYIAIASLLRFVSHASYRVFFWYRAVVAAVIVLLFFVR